ncbi:unnamed protein product [Calypogeia fissa]
MAKGKGKRKQSLEPRESSEIQNSRSDDPIVLESEAEKDLNDNDLLKGNSNKRPLGSKLAKENAKKQKKREDSMKIAAQAQKVMAQTGMEHLRVMEGQTLMNMLTMPTDGLDSDTMDFMRIWRQDEIAKMKERISKVFR